MCAGFLTVVDSRQHRDKSRHFSPLVCPDFSLRDGLPQGGYVVCDVRVSSVCGRIAPASDHIACAAAACGESEKHGCYGLLPRPHELWPFVIESGGAWGKGARKLFDHCKEQIDEARGPRELGGNQGFPELEGSWSANSFTNYHRQRVSVALRRGLGGFFAEVAGLLRGERPAGAGGVAGVGAAGPAGGGQLATASCTGVSSFLALLVGRPLLLKSFLSLVRAINRCPNGKHQV